jgi:hypothetical protein
MSVEEPALTSIELVDSPPDFSAQVLQARLIEAIPLFQKTQCLAHDFARSLVETALKLIVHKLGELGR